MMGENYHCERNTLCFPQTHAKAFYQQQPSRLRNDKMPSVSNAAEEPERHTTFYFR